MFHTLLKHISVSVYIVVVFTLSVLSFCLFVLHLICEINYIYKCHNYLAILHKLYTWFGKNQLRLYLNGATNFSIGGGPRGPL